MIFTHFLQHMKRKMWTWSYSGWSGRTGLITRRTSSGSSKRKIDLLDTVELWLRIFYKERWFWSRWSTVKRKLKGNQRSHIWREERFFCCRSLLQQEDLGVRRSKRIRFLIQWILCVRRSSSPESNDIYMLVLKRKYQHTSCERFLFPFITDQEWIYYSIEAMNWKI